MTKDFPLWYCVATVARNLFEHCHVIPKFNLNLPKALRIKVAKGPLVLQMLGLSTLLGGCQGDPAPIRPLPPWIQAAYSPSVREQTPVPALPPGARIGAPETIAPAASRGDSGAGGGLPTEPSLTSGMVWSLDTRPPRPIHGAIVRTTDGRTGTTESNGVFRLKGPPPADGVYLATATGHVASAIAGHHEARPNLHLKPITGVFPASSVTGESPMRIRGRCVDDAGRGLPGIVLLLGLGGGQAPSPVTSAADGSFTVDVFAPGSRIEKAVLLAVDPNQAWLGAWTNLTLSGTEVWLDDAPTAEPDNPLTLQAASHRLQVFVDRANMVGRINSAVSMVAPNGTTLGLFGDAQNAKVAQLSGIRWALDAEISDAQATVRSRLHRPELQLNRESNHTVIYEALLPAPSGAEDLSLKPGEPLGWKAVPGAGGYTLELKSLDSVTPLHWEAFSIGATLPAPVLPEFFTAGTYQATLTAWDTPQLLPRHLAQIPSRALRLPQLNEGYRQASRRFQVTLP